jgi:hypothetical protein
MIYRLRKGFVYTIPMTRQSISVPQDTPLKCVMSYPIFLSNPRTGGKIEMLIYRFVVLLDKEYVIELNQHQFNDFVNITNYNTIWNEANA